MKEDDSARWDAFVEAHPRGWICDDSAWKRVLERSFKHMRGSFVALEDPQGGALRAGLAVYYVRSPILGNRLVSVPFATLSDPLISDGRDAGAFRQTVLDCCRDCGASHAEIRTYRTAAMLAEAGMHTAKVYKHHYLELDRDLESIRLSFGRTAVRQMISKAERSGVKVREGRTGDDLRTFYRLLTLTRRRLAIPPIPYRFFRALWEELAPSGRAVLSVAERDGRTLGGLLSLTWKGVYALEYAGDVTDARKSGVVQLLYWAAIRSAHAQGCRMVSFGRTSPNNSGLMEYKAHWGSKVEDLLVFKVPESAQVQTGTTDDSWKYQFVRRLARVAPMPLYRLLGEFCYRHMG